MGARPGSKTRYTVLDKFPLSETESKIGQQQEPIKGNKIIRLEKYRPSKLAVSPAKEKIAHPLPTGIARNTTDKKSPLRSRIAHTQVSESPNRQYIARTLKQVTQVNF